MTCLKNLGFKQCIAEVCVFRLIEDERVTTTAVVHVDGIFAVGQKDRCDCLCVDSNRMVPVKGELKWYGGCHYSKDRERGSLKSITTEFRRGINEEMLCYLRSEFLSSNYCCVVDVALGFH